MNELTIELLESYDSNIEFLDISNIGIGGVLDLSRFTNLKELYCPYNNITNLDNLPYNLEILYCSSNNLTNLDNLPQSLKKLYCYYNELTNLNNLPPNFKKFDCSNNSLIASSENILKLICLLIIRLR